MRVAILAALIGALMGALSPVATHAIFPTTSPQLNMVAWYGRFTGTVVEYTTHDAVGRLVMRAQRLTPATSTPDTAVFAVDESTEWRTMDFHFEHNEIQRVSIHETEMRQRIPTGTRIVVFRDMTTEKTWRASTIYLLRRFEQP